MPKNSRYNKTLTKKLGKRKSTNIAALVVGVVVLLAGALIIISAFAGSSTYRYNASSGRPSGRLFSPDSPINQRISTTVQKTTLPIGYKAIFNSSSSPATNVSLLEWSYPIYDTTATSPTTKIWCSADLVGYGLAGQCPDITNSTVPVYMPVNPVPQNGSDKHLVVIDNVNKLSYDYAEWGRITPINPVQAQYTPGYGAKASYNGNGVGGGMNIARLAGGAGIIRTYEVQRGKIDHALVFTTSNTCRSFVYPAQASDGKGTDTNNCMPIGTRIQLDPNAKINPNASRFEKMIAYALQKYGAYVFDTGGIPSAGFAVERDRTTNRDVYQKATVGSSNQISTGQDLYQLKNIPWNNIFIVKSQWNSNGTKAYNW
jgi:hypothetical protein